MASKAALEKIVSHTLARSVNIVVHDDGTFATIHSSLPEPIILNWFHQEGSGDMDHRLAIMVPANASVTFNVDDGEVLDDISSKRHGID